MGSNNLTHLHRVGLIGADIGPSLSPELHEREAEELGLAYVYVRIDISRLGVPAAAVGMLVSGAHQRGFSGVNITHPGKQLGGGDGAELSPEAAGPRAV